MIRIIKIVSLHLSNLKYPLMNYLNLKTQNVTFVKENKPFLYGDVTYDILLRSNQ